MAYYSKDKQGIPRKGRNIDELLDKIAEAKIENGTISIGGESITPVTEYQDISGKANVGDSYTKQESDTKYATKQEIPDVSGFVEASDLASVATSGSYNDLSDKPTIPTVPTNVSAFNNDAGYLTQHQSLEGYATEQWVGQQGYLTQHQDISGKEDKSNKVTSWQVTPDNTHYPSEKLVKDSIDGVKVFIAEYGVTTRAEITTAYNNGRSLFVKYGNALIPLNNYEEDGGCFFAASDYLGQLRHCYINSNSTWATGLKQLENASSNRKQTITGNESSNTYYPTTKAVADYVTAQIGSINTILDEINGEEI